MADNADKKMWSGFVRTTWRRGPSFIGVWEPPQENFCSKKCISVYFKDSFVTKNKFHCEKCNALTSLPVLNLTFNIYVKHLTAAEFKDCVSFYKACFFCWEKYSFINFFSNTLQLFARKNPPCASQVLGWMLLCL